MFEIKRKINARTEVHHNNLRIVITFPEGKRKSISTGLKNNDANLMLAQRIVRIILDDVALGQFDYSLNKYRPQHSDKGGGLLLVGKLFRDFIAFKEPTLERNSLIVYRNTLLYIEQFLPGVTTDQLDFVVVQRLRDSLLKEVNPNTAKDYLMRISSCFEWAIKRQKVAFNPFKEIRSTIKSVEIKPRGYFEKDEVKLILSKAPSLIPEYSSFICFLLLTGCRPGEAIALKWNDVNFKSNKIRIDESFAQHKFKSTKTGKVRFFKMTPQVASYLMQGESRKDGNSLVFSFCASPINYGTFTYHWKIFLQQINIPHLSPYCCRHTFITLTCRELGQSCIADVANHVGNSPEVILKNYFHVDPTKTIGYTLS